ncbi:permease [Ligilactobacillus cholophilus]|uniref:permease n=1 Tax=Ligilactobacillus cholophilus TaxID=3050131 RepID=UPI0025AFF7AD|nr:permease [Ligilactobacillus cholophilus]
MSWITKNIFQMSWLNDFFNWIIFDLFGINSTSKFAHSVNYFLFDTTKIFILMSVLIFLMGVLQSFFPPEKTKNLLHKVNGVTGNILGAFLGAITPFCSCSSIPIFIGFTSSGLPLGVTFSFLFASPMIDIASVILLASFMGMKIAISYIFVGLLMSIIGGIIIKHLHMENQIADYVKNIQSTEVSIAALTWKNRIRDGIAEVRKIVGRVWKYVLIGVAIGALIHDWIPTSFIQNILGNSNPFSVILAVIVGVPMYADVFGVIPIATALLTKGVPIGTIIAFMMAVTMLSLPELIMLKKVLKNKLLISFITIGVIGIIIIGFGFNFVLG